MKRFFTVFFVVAILLTPFLSFGQSLNIVYIDLQKVMLESEQGKQIRKILTDDAERLKRNLDGKQAELQRLKDAIEKQGATITPEARADREKQYQAKLKDYQRLYNDYQTELQQKDVEYTQKVLKEIEEIVRGMGEREKYSLILEKSQAGILYGVPSIDITNKVITLFNEVAKKKPLK
ncbi:MAG TPA: OmpH family outer membrane protein [Syntrophorhabdaceae bacterium]|nr:OmpH family outer membrane protein [Syntrophorhabdaceae bacterium]